MSEELIVYLQERRVGVLNQSRSRFVVVENELELEAILPSGWVTS